MKIIVTEIQKFADGAMTTPSYAYDAVENTRFSPQADAKYHSILASAAVSAVPVHACIMYTEEGEYIESKCYKHEAQEETVES